MVPIKTCSCKRPGFNPAAESYHKNYSSTAKWLRAIGFLPAWKAFPSMLHYHIGCSPSHMFKRGSAGHAQHALPIISNQRFSLLLLIKEELTSGGEAPAHARTVSRSIDTIVFICKLNFNAQYSFINIKLASPPLFCSHKHSSCSVLSGLTAVCVELFCSFCLENGSPDDPPNFCALGPCDRVACCRQHY